MADADRSLLSSLTLGVTVSGWFVLQLQILDGDEGSKIEREAASKHAPRRSGVSSSRWRTHPGAAARGSGPRRGTAERGIAGGRDVYQWKEVGCAKLVNFSCEQNGLSFFFLTVHFSKQKHE